MKRLFSLMLTVLLIPALCQAEVELRRQKATATKYIIGIRNSSTGALISGAAGLDTECTKWDEGGTPGTPADITGEATELGSTGVYYVPLTGSASGETDADYILCQTKSSSTNAMTAIVMINTKMGTVFTNSSGQLATSTIPESAFAATNTFQTGSSTTSLVLASGETSNDLTGQTICIGSGTGAKDCALITAYNTSTKTATVTPAVTNAPASGDGYSLGNIAYAVVNSNLDKSGYSLATSQSFNTTGSVGSVTGNVGGSVGSVTGNVGGNVNGSVASVTAGVTVTTNNDKLNYGVSTTSRDAIADQVWDEARSGHATSGTFGAGVIVQTNNDKSAYTISGTKTTLDALQDISSANVSTQCTNALNTYDAPTKTEMDAAFTEIKGASFNTTTDSLRQIRLGGGGGGGGTCDEEVIADAVWDELLAGHTTTGSAAEIMNQALNTTLTCEAHRQ